MKRRRSFKEVWKFKNKIKPRRNKGKYKKAWKDEKYKDRRRQPLC